MTSYDFFRLLMTSFDFFRLLSTSFDFFRLLYIDSFNFFRLLSTPQVPAARAIDFAPVGRAPTAPGRRLRGLVAGGVGGHVEQVRSTKFHEVLRDDDRHFTQSNTVEHSRTQSNTV